MGRKTQGNWVLSPENGCGGGIRESVAREENKPPKTAKGLFRGIGQEKVIPFHNS